MENLINLQGRLHSEYWRNKDKFNEILSSNGIFLFSCKNCVCCFNIDGVICKIDFLNFKHFENNVILIDSKSYNPINNINLKIVKTRISYFKKLCPSHYQYTDNKRGYELAVKYGFSLCCYCISYDFSKKICLPHILKEDILLIHRFLAFCYWKYDSDEVNPLEKND